MRWATKPKTILFLSICVLLIVGLFLFRSTSPKQETSLPKTYNLRNSTWLWESPNKLSEEEFTQMVAFAKEKNIKVIHLFAEDYLSKSVNLQEFNAKVKNLISIANSNGIEVEALAGSVDWAEPENEDLPITFLEHVLEFNEEDQPEKFSGVQFDIEFYNHENFTKDKTRYSENYLKLVNKLSNKVKEANMDNFKLGFAISHSLDSGRGLVPKVDFNGDTLPVFEHLLNILKDTNSYLVIMAYRNSAQGNNSTVEISKDEINLTDQQNSNVEIYIGQETEENEVEYITFYGMSQADVVKATYTIADFFEKSKSFKGISIHTLEGFEKLKEN